MEFQLGQPFRPYQQLMGVLPDRSKQIVPKPYHDLMTNPDSPIIDFYPRDFELDMNGKKMDWEAVVKIPFIDETRLLNAMKTRDHLLSDAENERNEFGVTLKFSYSPEDDFAYPSSLTGIFPDLEHCHCIENIFELPTMEGLDFHVGLSSGVKLGEQALAGFPSLKTLSHSGSLGFHGVSVFQQDSRNESMVITLIEPEECSKVNRVKEKLGKKVYVGYPFLAEAKIVGVSDELFSYTLPPEGFGPPIAAPHGPQELPLWRKKAERIENFYSKRLGMVIGQVEVLVYVDMLKRLKKTDDGASIKEYSPIPGIEAEYAAQMLVDNVVSEDQRFIEKSALVIEEEFPIGTGAFFLGEYNYGRPLEVVGHNAGKVEIWVSSQNGKVADFGRRIVAESARLAQYAPSFAVAKSLGLNPLVLSKITSAFHVIVDDVRVNLGLNLKFEAKQLKVLGYTRKSPSGWEFSSKAIQLIQQYMVNYPEFIAGIQRNPQGKEYAATEFYPTNEAKSRIREIQNWLKQIESKSFEKVPLNADQLDSEVVRKIEIAADEMVHSNISGAGKNQRIKGVPRKGLLKPSDTEHRLGHQRFALGDRVVYVQDSGRVPIATLGTVVGMMQTPRTTLLDILFDVTFMSGTSLDNRCSPFRGSTVPIHSVLNLTDRQVIALSRAAENQRPQTSVQPFTVSGHAQPLGRNQQLLPAQAPPPLRGSFRGALAKQGSGPTNRQTQGTPIRSQPSPHPDSDRGRTDKTRGRGTGLRHISANENAQIAQGSSDLETGKMRQSGPPSYSNVPPPASINKNSPGRGRGRYHGGSHRGENFQQRRMARESNTIVVQPQ